MNSIETSTITLCELLSSANFQISSQHRRYIWDYGKCERLEEDILNIIDWNKWRPNKVKYYMGNLILQPTASNDDPTYLIIDGANRLITLSLFLSRILHRLIKITTDTNRKNQYQELIKLLLYTENQPKITLSNPDDTQYYFDLLKYGTNECPHLDVSSLVPHRDRLAFNNYMLTTHANSDVYLLEQLNTTLKQLIFTTYLVNDNFEASLATFSGVSRGESYNELEILKHYLLLWVDYNIQNKEQHDYFADKIISLCEKINTYHDTVGLDMEEAMKDVSETNKSLKTFVQQIFEIGVRKREPNDSDAEIDWWRGHWAIENSMPITDPDANTILHFLQTIETEFDRERNRNIE